MKTETAEAGKAVTQTGGGHLVAIAQPHPRNEIMALRPELFEAVEVNLSAAQRRTATLTGRRTVKKAWQAAWLLKAVEAIDLTTLSGDDTPGRVHRLCAKAKNPLRHDLVEAVRDWPHSSFHREVRRGVVPADWAGTCGHGAFGEQG